MVRDLSAVMRLLSFYAAALAFASTAWTLPVSYDAHENDRALPEASPHLARRDRAPAPCPFASNYIPAGYHCICYRETFLGMPTRLDCYLEKSKDAIDKVSEDHIASKGNDAELHERTTLPVAKLRIFWPRLAVSLRFAPRNMHGRRWLLLRRNPKQIPFSLSGQGSTPRTWAEGVSKLSQR